MPTKKDEKKKKPKFKVVPRKKKEQDTMKTKTAPMKKKEDPKKAPAKKKIKFKVVPKKEEKPKPKKNIKFKVVPKKQPVNLFYQTPAEKMINKSKEQMNMMKQTELFGQLPKELRQKILNPKETGVKVGSRINDLEKYIAREYSYDYDDTLKQMQETANFQDRHYEDAFLPILLEPARTPKKNLKSYKPEFSSRDFIKHNMKDDESENLYDLAYSMKFSHENFRDFLNEFNNDEYNSIMSEKDVYEGYPKYWLDYMVDEMDKRGKIFGI
jgi:hypothetical protein